MIPSLPKKVSNGEHDLPSAVIRTLTIFVEVLKSNVGGWGIQSSKSYCSTEPLIHLFHLLFRFLLFVRQASALPFVASVLLSSYFISLFEVLFCIRVFPRMVRLHICNEISSNKR